jgi:hypothetical protein
MRKDFIQNLGKQITDIFDRKEIELISKSCKFIKRTRKITAYELLELIVFDPSNNYLLSLEDISNDYYKKHNIRVSKQAINKKFTKNAVQLIKMIIEKVISKSAVEHAYTLPLCFNQIRIKDSTSFRLPDYLKEYYPGSGGKGNASKASVKIQFEFDVKTGKVIDLEIVPFIATDQRNALETLDSIKEDDLVIRDLGYFSAEALQKISLKKAWFLSRLDTATNIYGIKNDKPAEIDLQKIEKKMARQGLSHFQIEAYIGGALKLKCRIIIMLVPEDVKNERLRKYYSKYGKTPAIRKRKYVLRAGLNILITNIPKQQVAVENIRHIYSIRWQIELIFKSWKSIGQIHKIRQMKIDRFEFMLYARLLWLLVNWNIINAIDKYMYRHYKFLLSHYVLLKRLYKDKKCFSDLLKPEDEKLGEYLREFMVFCSEKGKRTENKKRKNLKDIYKMLINNIV